MKLGQGAADSSRETKVDLAARELGRQHALLRQAPHPHRRLARPGLAADAVVAVPLGDFDDAQVHLGTEPPIEAQLLVAVGAAPLDGGEVEKPEVHRLLELVGIGAGEQDPRAVRLVKTHVVGRRLICVGPQ